MARQAGYARLTDNARTILEARYLAPGESPDDLFRRVARHVAQAEKARERRVWEERFYQLMASLRFLPNSPTLFNAGRHEHGSLSACFVIPINDSMNGIMRAAWAQAMTLKWGGGTGFSLSQIRPRGDAISTVHGKACGPVAVLRLLNQVSRTVTQSGMREGANMAVLDASHPDVLEFVRCKNEDPGAIGHFNISVAASDEFMRAVAEDREWELRNPRDGSVAGRVRARELFREICQSAWRTGDPGLLFLDRINRDNPFREQGLLITATNPCVTADTWVMTAEGPRQVSELVGRPCLLLVNGRAYYSPEGFFQTGTRPVVRLETKEGYSLRLTRDHPVLKVKNLTPHGREVEWVPAGDLQPGDLVVLNNHRPVSGWPGLWGREEGYMAARSLLEIIARLGLSNGRLASEWVERTSSDFYHGYLHGLLELRGIRRGSRIVLRHDDREDLLVLQRMLLRLGVPSRLSRDGLEVEGDDAIYLAELLALDKRLRPERPGRKPQILRFVATVSAVVPDGEEPVYDVQVPGINAFDANGFLVHNCGEEPLLPWENCTLGHMNLVAYLTKDGFDFNAFREDIAVAVRFLDDVVTVNTFPVPKQREWNLKTRRIGLGVMGLHDVLIALGIPYDSEEALDFARAVASAWREASDAASLALGEERGPYGLWKGSGHYPNERYRNAWRRTVAPTGTVAIIAGVSSGIEPWFSFAHERRTAEGRVLVEAHEGLRRELLAAGLKEGQVEELFSELIRGRRLSELKGVPERVKAVYRSALEISWSWHVRMQAAWQEHCDSGISKTVNLPNKASVEDVWEAYEAAWRLGCKGITIFRDGCRSEQVLSHRRNGREQAATAPRRRLPDERASLTHKFQIGELEGYITAGLYEDGSLGEVFIRASKEGSLVSGLLDALGIALSIALQHGVPIEAVTRKLKGISFEPAGMTSNRHIPVASSVVDYIARWIELRFGNGKASEENGGRACPECGGLLRMQEGCHVCAGCGYSKCG